MTTLLKWLSLSGVVRSPKSGGCHRVPQALGVGLLVAGRVWRGPPAGGEAFAARDMPGKNSPSTTEGPKSVTCHCERGPRGRKVMAMFDALIDDIASRFGLGSNAGPLVREVLAIITGSPGGVSGFLNTLKSAGLSSEVASWMGQANATPLPADRLRARARLERARRDRGPARTYARARIDRSWLRTAKNHWLTNAGRSCSCGPSGGSEEFHCGCAGSNDGRSSSASGRASC